MSDHALLPANSNQNIEQTERRLTAPEYRALAEVPPEVEWFGNILE